MVQQLSRDDLAEASLVGDKTEALDADPRDVLADLSNRAHLRRDVLDKETTEGRVFSGTLSSAPMVVGFSLKGRRSFETKQPTGEVAIQTW